MAGESLRVVSGNAGGKEISFEDEFEIGRAAEGDGTLGDDPEISRRHARITRRAGDQLTIEDLGSTNGTFVNGKRIEEATPLTPGDTVKMGTTTIQVLDAAGKAPQATALGTTQPDPDEGKTKAASTVPPPAPPAPKPAAPAPPAARRRSGGSRREGSGRVRAGRRAPARRWRRTAARTPAPAARPLRRRRCGKVILAAVLGLLVVAGVVVGVLALTGGGRRRGREQGPQHPRDHRRQPRLHGPHQHPRARARRRRQPDRGQRRRLGHRLQRQPRPGAHQRARRGRPELDQGQRRRQRGERRRARPRTL